MSIKIEVWVVEVIANCREAEDLISRFHAETGKGTIIKNCLVISFGPDELGAKEFAEKWTSKKLAKKQFGSPTKGYSSVDVVNILA